VSAQYHSKRPSIASSVLLEKLVREIHVYNARDDVYRVYYRLFPTFLLASTGVFMSGALDILE
jgi:hypothetical protein